MQENFHTYEKDLLMAKNLKSDYGLHAEEEPNFDFYTSRLVITHADIVDFYKNTIRKNPNIELKLLHFFINTGITDTAYYWT